MRRVIRIIICFTITFSITLGMTHTSFATIPKAESDISMTNTVVMEAIKNVRIEEADITAEFIKR